MPPRPTARPACLVALPPTHLLTSDLRRARATMEPLAALTGLPVGEDARLRETHFGDWQGLAAAEVEARDPGDVLRVAARGGRGAGRRETRSQVAERAAAALREAVAALPPDAVVVATTHGGTARAALGRLLGLPLPLWSRLGGLANCSWSVLEEDAGGWRLAEHNAGTLPVLVIGDDVT